MVDAMPHQLPLTYIRGGVDMGSTPLKRQNVSAITPHMGDTGPLDVTSPAARLPRKGAQDRRTRT